MILGLGIAMYSAVLVILGRSWRATTIIAFRDGNQRLSPWTIFVMVTALWSASLIAVQIDTAYQSGVSAVWYGISVAVMSLLVSTLIPWFRRHHYVSNSDLLGTAFGPLVRRLSGLVISLTFPIFALSNALAAGVFLEVALHWPLALSLLLTTIALVAYIQFAGILSIARTQGLNLVMVVAGLVLATWKLGHSTALPRTLALPPSYWHWFGIGHGLILVWFGMNTLNVFSAQVEIQAVAAAKDIRHAQQAVWLSTAILLVIIGVSTWLGIVARELTPQPHLEGLVAYSLLLVHQSSPWFVAVIGISMWAMALMWCGPLLFSGAISLGADVLGYPKSVWAMRGALILESILMVLYALWRPGEVAWWRVFGLTLRNAAVVGPTLAVITWTDLPPISIFTAMISGIIMGLGLNAWTGFSPTHFVWGINPMWSAATTTFVIIALWQNYRHRGFFNTLSSGILWLAATIILIHFGTSFTSDGLLGVLVFSVGVVLWGYVWVLSRVEGRRRPTPSLTILKHD
ncbi:MAG: hypothetical protein C7B46_14155 [Sulfobacillus benefaciens]|uniref:Sodium:solute symporter n=1 Tax=Sulfobacillus benefaciens TaxID=453960 RepID=A0A2T2XD80_9FIRM|nr:MAG: hypothetical protein C7B46_14155 [Sulfobacillus benefaciens]